MTPVDTEPTHRLPASALRRGARRVPGAHAAYRAVHRVDREVNALGHWLRAEAAQRLRPGARDATPLRQAPSVRRVELPVGGDLDAFAAALVARGVEPLRGGSGVYLPPQPALAELASAYPPDTGFKLVRADAVGGLAGAQERLRAAGALCVDGLAPRPYDLVELSGSGLLAYAVEHVGGAELPPAERDAVAPRVEQAARAAGLVPRDERWRASHHFRAADGAAGFLGADHFAFEDPDAPVRRLLSAEARSDLHFGLEYRLRGGRYLYQSVPTVGATGRRDSSRRWRFMSALLAEHGISVRDRVVLDVGCNAGMMLASTLADGAAWGIGWDRPAVVGRGRALLLALGFTRHELIPGELERDRPLVAETPAHLRSRLDGSIVLYLAIRHHIGWLQELADVGWRAMLYEGGEHESVATLEQSLAGLRQLCDFDVAAAVDFRDGESEPRPVALLVRR